jgi:hypothetical protein
MRRLAAVLLVATAGSLPLATAVSAQPGTSLNREVSGPFSGTTSEVTGGCLTPLGLGLRQLFDATYQPGSTSGSVHIDVCVVPDVPSVSVAVGTFELTNRTGATLTGTAGGIIGFLGQFGDPIALLDFTLSVTDGTRRFQRVTGTITLDGAWDLSNPPFDAISGTLSGSLQR